MRGGCVPSRREEKNGSSDVSTWLSNSVQLFNQILILLLL